MPDSEHSNETLQALEAILESLEGRVGQNFNFARIMQRETRRIYRILRPQYRDIQASSLREQIAQAVIRQFAYEIGHASAEHGIREDIPSQFEDGIETYSRGLENEFFDRTGNQQQP